MDNHESHLSIEALNLAKSSGVTILTLHPHTTAKLQPLDVGLNGQFKTYYNAAVDSWLLRNPGQSLTTISLSTILPSVLDLHIYLKTMTSVIQEMWHISFHDSNYRERKYVVLQNFLPSTVTDKPLITPSNAEQNPEQSENIAPSFNDSQNSNAQLGSTIQTYTTTYTATVIQDLDLSPSILMSQDHIEESLNVPVSSPGLLQSSGPTPSTSKKIILPMDFLPPIKAKPRTMKRRRVPGKSMIATDTREKDAIAKKKNKENKKQVDRAKQDLFKGDNKIRKESNKSKKKAHDVDTSDEEEFIPSGSSSGGEEFIDQNDDEDGVIILDRNFLPIPRDPQVNEFVLVEFPLKKKEVYYVAKILEIIDDNEDDSNFFVSCLRLKNRTRQTFYEPINPDLTGILIRNIKYILPDPKIIGSSQRQASISFNVHFDMTELNLR